VHDGGSQKPADGGALNLERLIAIARGERSGEIVPATAGRLAQFQAAFDAAPLPAAAPAAICFAFHAPVPPAEAAVKYRDVAIDHGKFDYDRIVRHCIAAALAAQPGTQFILATDARFLDGVSHPALTIVRLPLDAASPMYERVMAMCAFVRSRQFNAPAVFLDSDAFLNAPVASLFQGHFDIGATYRPDPGLMPVNEGVILADSRNKAAVRAFFAGYLGTYDRLCGNAAVTGYYGNVKRWRGGQLSLNALTCPPGVPSAMDSAKAFGARIRYYPCATFNFSIELDRPYSARQLDVKAVLHLKGPRKAILDQIIGYQTQRRQKIAGILGAPRPAETNSRRDAAPDHACAPDDVPIRSAAAPLAEIAEQPAIDKSSPAYRALAAHERYFEPFRSLSGLRLLETSIGDSASAAMWSRYFSDAHIFREENAARSDARFDIVIDDGGRNDADIAATFHRHWPELSPNGLFVIAGLERTRDPDGSARSFAASIDQWLAAMGQPHSAIEFIHIYRDAAFIRKAG
jgi:hypothetical protein